MTTIGGLTVPASARIVPFSWATGRGFFGASGPITTIGGLTVPASAIVLSDSCATGPGFFGASGPITTIGGLTVPASARIALLSWATGRGFLGDVGLTIGGSVPLSARVDTAGSPAKLTVRRRRQASGPEGMNAGLRSSWYFPLLSLELFTGTASIARKLGSGLLAQDPYIRSHLDM